MATGVLTKNPHTMHHSTNQATSGTKLNASDMGPQNAQDARSTLDHTADQILAKLKLSLEESEARAMVEALEKMLRPKYPMSLDVRRRCFRGMVKLCGEYGILPSSHIISESKVHKLGDDPLTSSGFSYVWPGMYGEAGDGEDEDEGRCVAIKVIQYSESDDIQAIRKSFCREVITWKRLSHPNILELIGVMMDEKQYSMVSPWMDNGNIMEFLRENLQANPLKLLEDVAHGLEYLHGMGLAHGDLKGENVLVSGEERACLADIGLTRVAGELNSVLSSTSTTNGTVTARWCPRERLYPEMFGSKTGSRPTKRSDIYSMAMTIYEVLTDRIPFYEYNDYAATVHIIRGEPPKKPIFFITRGYTQELWDMTISCWDVDPSKRPTVDRVLSALIIAAAQWRPKHGGFSTQDDCDQTASEEESNPLTDLEPEDEPVDDAPGSPDPLQPLVIETPVLVPPPSIVKDPAQFKSRPKTVIPGKEETEPGPVRISREEGHDPIPVPPGDADIRVIPVVPPKQDEKYKLGPVTLKDEVARPAPDRRSREEPTEPTLAAPRKEAASSATDNPRKKELPSSYTPATSLGGDRHTSKAKVRSDPIPDTLEEGAKVSHERTDGISPKKKEAKSVATNLPREEEVFRPALDQRETGSAPTYDPQKVETRLKERPAGCESNPHQRSRRIHQ